MEGCTHYLAMVLVQLIYGGSDVLIKLSLQDGLNPIVFVVYRHVLAMVFIGPFAYVLERKQRPSFSISAAANIFLLALLGPTIFVNVYCAGLKYTSATVASALSNVIPTLTFLTAVLLGMEKLKIRSARGQAKVAGTIFCIGGSLIFTFWKGGYLLKGVEKPLINVYDYDAEKYIGRTKHVHENWIKGSALILISYIAWSAWLILQAAVSKVYPAPLSLTTLMCFFASLQSSFLALFFARNPSSWRLEWNLQLLTIIYFGVLTTALVYYLQAWCISHKGPVFAAMFSPLQAITVAVFSAIAFAERLHFGSLIGALLIIVGLYCVLWGKRKDSLAKHGEIEKVRLDDIKVQEISMNDISVVNSVTREET
ncbi:WAT1-related protein At5g64700-like [Pyrus communis]|uniref:WAT1-related protein At5g64700-like n=1 Tax=Pyrus communis TaxID=23211 RepID=UPI0035BFE099